MLDEKAFRAALIKHGIADRLERGEFPSYWHANGACCVIGLTLQEELGLINMDRLISSEFMDGNRSLALSNLWTTADMAVSEYGDQKAGARKVRKYLAKTELAFID